MNKIYKVIWNRVRHCYVVVSEITKNHGKERSTNLRVSKGLCALTLAIGLSLSSYAFAADPVDLGNGSTAAYDDKGNLTVGKMVQGQGTDNAGMNNTTIGTNTDTLRNVTEGDTSKNGQPMDTDANTKLVDGEGQAHSLDLSTESGGSTAVGYNNRAEGDNSTAIGNTAKIINKPVTYYADADGNKTTSTDDAAWYKDSSGNPTQVPQVFRDASGNTTTTPQYKYTHTVTAADGSTSTVTDITTDKSLADKNTDGTPAYNYQKSDNISQLYSVVLYQSADNSIAAGTSVTANGSNAVAVGYNSTADNSAVAVGDTAVAKENAVAIGKETKASVEGSIALGKGSEANRPGGVTGWDPKTGTTSVKTGTEWTSGAGALSIGSGTVSRQITGVAAGSEDSDAVNLAQLKEAMTHYYSVKTTEATDAAGNNNYLNDGATGNNALAAGVSAVATGDNATAVGTQTYASGEDASAYGYRAAAMGKDSVSIGSGTSAQQEGSVAIGGHAKGTYSVEVGYGSTAQGTHSTSVGGHAIGNYSIAIGSENVGGNYSNPATAGGDNSIAIGGHTNSANDIAIGAGSATSGGQAVTVGGSATGKQAVSVGNSANATKDQATAIGWGSSATGSQSTAVGGHAGDTNATAVGQGANATYAYATAVGNSSVASGDHSTALGYGTSSQGSNSTAIGGASANGTNVTAIGKGSTAGASSWYNTISDSTAIGGAHISASNATAIGSNATVNAQYGVALGNNSNVSEKSTGVGAETKASNTGTAVGYGAQASGYQSVAVGAGSNATGQNAVSLGGGGAWGNYSIALGSGAGTTAHAIALGQNSGAWGENAIAIGEGTNAWRANSIVLGKNSKSGADKNIEGYDPRTGVASVDKTATWYSTDEAVSIGRAEERDENGNITATAITRQLNNLAAGTLDTDAVNVAQLKAATQKVSMHDYSVWSPDTETDTNYTNGGAIAKNSMAAGVSASTTKDAQNAVAIGYKAKAEGIGATVIGQYGTATGRYALAFGGQQTDTTAIAANNVASGDNAVSFGERTTASGNNSTAFGQGTRATEERATAFGQRTQATQSNATAFGIDTLASGQSATAFGNLTQATAIGATAFGNKNQATGQYATAWGGGDKVVKNEDGTTSKIGTVASGTYATAFGERTIASGESATAFGSDSTASGKNSLAFGENSTAAAENSMAALGGTVAETATNSAAIGNGAQAKLADTVALGSGSVADRASGAKGYDMLTKGDTTNTSTAWISNGNAIAVGNGSTLIRQITGVAAGSLDTDAVNVAQLKAAGFQFTTNTRDNSNTTDNYTGYKIVNRQLGDTISIKAGDADPNKKYVTTNLTTDIANNGDITISMAESPTFNIVTVTSLELSPKDTTTKDKDGYMASAQLDAHYRNGSLNPDKNVTMADGSTGMVRLHYHDGEGTIHDLATMDDGQIYAGDIKTDGTLDTIGFGRKMNEKTTINGGVTNKDKLTDSNIGVVSNGTDTLTVKLAKNLKGLESVQAGKTTMDDNGLIIRKSDDDSSKNVVVLSDKVAFGDNQVNNMGSGADGTGADGKPTYNTLNNGANIGDVKNIASSTVQPVIDTVNQGWELDVNGTKQKAVTPTSPKVNLIQGQNITITGDADNTDNVTIATADDVRFHTVRVGGVKTDTGYMGGIVIGEQSGGDSANPDENDYITGLKNINWDSTKIQSGRAATEDQLQKVAEDIKQGTVAGDVYVTGGEVTYHTDGGTDNGQPTVNDGTGKLTLTENNKTTKVEITGLHDYYVTSGTVTDDGKTLELTRNDVDDSGNHQKITVDLGNVLKNDQHLVANPAVGSEGKYTVNTTDGTVTLKVKNGEAYNDITIGGFEGLGQGLKFGANKMAVDGGGNPMTNQLGSTINITGAGTKELKDYSGKNLLTSVEQDADGNTTIHVLMDKNVSADGVTVGQAGKDGVAGADGEVGQSGTIGINGKNGVAGDDGKQGITTTLIRTEKGQAGKDGEMGQQGAPGVDGNDITRIVYQNDTNGDGRHILATLDDGLKFSGDDNSVITKKLNEQLQFVGGAEGNLTQNNIGVVERDGKLWIQLAETLNLGEKGNLKAGDAQIGWFAGDVLTKTNGTAEKQGSYATGLDNKEWDISNPSYVSGRAATEDQLKIISDEVKHAATTAGQHTVVTVNDNKEGHDTKATAGNGAFGEYAGTDTDNLLIAAKKEDDGLMTYNIKLNDQLTIGQKGADGKDGKVTVETKGGTTVVIGHDGKDGEDGKDGLFVIGRDGADGESGVSIIGPNGATGADGIDGKVGITGKDGKDVVSISGKDGVGHIGLTGPKGEQGADGTPGRDGASIDVSTDYGTKTLESTKNITVDNKEQSSRIIYNDAKGSHEVATMDDGLKFVGNDGKEVAKKLNSTLSLTGGMDKDAVAKASSKNLGVRSNEKGDGLEIVMTDTPDFEKVTIGKGTDTTQKITIGEQTVTGKKSDGSTSESSQTGNYITGLDNKAWDKDNIVENRAATEGQLKDAINEISGKDKGGFGLADENGGIVKKDLGQTVTVKGDGKNIETKVNGDALEVSLKKDVDLGDNGSIKAGATTIDKDGVKTNEVKVGDITINDKGINGGAKQITNIASGIDGNPYADAKDNNAASIGDVKKIAGDEAGKAAEAVKSKSGKNITVKDDHTVNLNDNITLGDETDASKQVSIDGNNAKVTAGDGANKVTVDGSKGQVTIGSGDKTMTLGKQANTAGDSNPAEGNYLNGLDNTQWDGKNIQSGRAATEDQLKTVSDKVNSGRVFQGDDGKEVKVGMGDTLKIQGGVKAEDISQENNIGIVKGADDTLNIRLAKDLKGLDSVTTGNTTINNNGLTIKTGDANRTITVQDGNVNMGGNTISGVADGKVSKDSTDAVNGSQLFATNQTVANLGGAVNKLGTRVNRVGAGAAALAALHPLDFDPDDKWDFAAGYGNYKDASAVAVGAYYRPNEDTMFSVGGSFGGGENMVNAGVSFKVGQGNHVSTSRVAMAKEIKDLRQDVANLNAIVNRQSALINKLTGTNAGTVSDTGHDLFPDVPANHWAYEYVTKLKQAGILTGYPDGNFDGDRMMTRYEFAAIVYRAIMAGAASNPALSQDGTLDKLAKEFSPEMKHIRIDTIAKDKNGKPTIERVRVIPDAQQ